MSKYYIRGLMIFFVLVSLLVPCISGIAASKNESVTSVKIVTPKNINVIAGKKLKLKVKVKSAKAQNKKVMWKSSNKKIATVSSDGIVTAKRVEKNKKVIITAYSKINPKKKASIKLVIKPAKVSQIQILSDQKIIKTKTVTLSKYGQTITFDKKISPSIAGNKSVKWSSNDTGIASVSATGVVTLKKEGVVVITAIAKDGSNKKASVELTIRKALQPTTEKKPEITEEKQEGTTENKTVITEEKQEDTTENKDEDLSEEKYDYNIKIINPLNRILYNKVTIPFYLETDNPSSVNLSISADKEYEKVNSTFADIQYTGEVSNWSDSINPVTGGYIFCLRFGESGTNKIYVKSNDKVVYEYEITLNDYQSAESSWYSEVLASVTNTDMTPLQQIYAVENYMKEEFRYITNREGSYVINLIGHYGGYFQNKEIDCWDATAILSNFAKRIGLESSVKSIDMHRYLIIKYQDKEYELDASPYAYTNRFDTWETYDIKDIFINGTNNIKENTNIDYSQAVITAYPKDIDIQVGDKVDFIALLTNPDGNKRNGRYYEYVNCTSTNPEVVQIDTSDPDYSHRLLATGAGKTTVTADVNGTEVTWNITVVDLYEDFSVIPYWYTTKPQTQRTLSLGSFLRDEETGVGTYTCELYTENNATVTDKIIWKIKDLTPEEDKVPYIGIVDDSILNAEPEILSVTPDIEHNLYTGQSAHKLCCKMQYPKYTTKFQVTASYNGSVIATYIYTPE